MPSPVTSDPLVQTGLELAGVESDMERLPLRKTRHAVTCVCNHPIVQARLVLTHLRIRVVKVNRLFELAAGLQQA